ncbi:MAG TPA: helix-turn-helix domain-containing protein [Solirubrobacterales bacterium]|nr:helix-turn-helix domain-containing protein [Solirubrobacterales bacterium]
MEEAQGAGDGDERKENSEPWEGPDYVNEDVARAMAHPMRVKILAELNKRVMSPSQFAKKFHEKLSNVSYHFRALQKLGCIEEVETRQVRGAVEHFYRATKRVLFDGKPWDELPQSLRAGVSGQTVSDFLEAVAIAMDAETFDAQDERMAVWFQRRLDVQGWEDAVEVQRDLVRRMCNIYKDSKLRLAEAGEPDGGMLGTYGLFLFESPPPEPESDEQGGADE